MNLRGQELLIILLIVVLIFGARKLPELARSLGSSAKEFRKGIEEGSKEDPEDAPVTDATESDPAASDIPDAKDS
ncbi:MAG TPA: twin-arginine translocase TatA/TatE family subunit [Acidimicrobiia bacterium]